MNADDDEAGNRGAGFTERMTSELDAVAGWNRRSPQGEDHKCNCYSRAFKDPMQHAPTCPARSPQGEDNK
jgi:hypothetical protein